MVLSAFLRITGSFDSSRTLSTYLITAGMSAALASGASSIFHSPISPSRTPFTSARGRCTNTSEKLSSVIMQPTLGMIGLYRIWESIVPQESPHLVPTRARSPSAVHLPMMPGTDMRKISLSAGYGLARSNSLEARSQPSGDKSAPSALSLSYCLTSVSVGSLYCRIWAIDVVVPAKSVNTAADNSLQSSGDERGRFAIVITN
jgi:hypothetical protein